jgi:hypothetical protein
MTDKQILKRNHRGNVVREPIRTATDLPQEIGATLSWRGVIRADVVAPLMWHRRLNPRRRQDTRGASRFSSFGRDRGGNRMPYIDGSTVGPSRPTPVYPRDADRR